MITAAELRNHQFGDDQAENPPGVAADPGSSVVVAASLRRGYAGRLADAGEYHYSLWQLRRLRSRWILHLSASLTRCLTALAANDNGAIAAPVYR